MHGFLVAVEAEPEVDPDSIGEKMVGALTWVEGVGKVDMNYLGDIEIIDEDELKEMN